MTNHLNKLIDHNLLKISSSEHKGMLDANFTDCNNVSIPNYNIISRSMEEDGLISKNKDTCYITEKGERIIKEGGWLKHLEFQEIAQDEEKQLHQLERDKLNASTKLAKFQVKYRWLPFLFSFLSLLISIIALLFSILK